MLPGYEEKLFPAFQVVLSEDIQEFHPYVFQIFAQLVELRRRGDPLPPVYLTLFPPLLSPTFWERSGNVPALVRLLRAYLSRAGAEIVARGHLAGVLGVFQKLIASRAHDHQGFYILNTLFEALDLALLAQYLPHIWQLLFSRLQGSRTPKFARSLVVFMAVFAMRHGVGPLTDSLEAVQPGITLMLVQQVCIPALPTITGGSEEKLVAAAATRLLTQAPQLKADGAAETWAALLSTLVEFVDAGGTRGASVGERRGRNAWGRGGRGGSDSVVAHILMRHPCTCSPLPCLNCCAGAEQQDGEEEEYAGYTAAFAKLHNAQT